MGKFIYLILTVVAVQIVLLVAFNQEIPGSALWDLFTNPSTNWIDLSLTSLISSTIVAISAGAIIIGTFVYKMDFLVFAGLAGVFYSFASQLTHAWDKICSQITPYINPTETIANTCGSGVPQLLASIIVFPILILYIFAVIEWWRGRD